MTEREINEKAREIYIRCFDDVGEYVGVINALVIAVRETSRELEAQIEKMKCCDNCQHCGCGSCDEAGNCICDDCNEETLSEWECIL